MESFDYSNIIFYSNDDIDQICSFKNYFPKGNCEIILNEINERADEVLRKMDKNREKSEFYPNRLNLFRKRKKTVNK